MNCMLKRVVKQKQKQKKKRKKSTYLIMSPQSLALEGGLAKGKKLCKPRVNISTTNEDLSWSCELVTLVSSMTYFHHERLLTPGLCGPVNHLIPSDCPEQKILRIFLP